MCATLLSVNSGQIEGFRPAQYVKPPGLIRRVLNLIPWFNPKTPSTTEQGAAATASPSTNLPQLTSQRYDRFSLIRDVRALFMDDMRVHKSVLMHAHESVRRGMIVNVRSAPTEALQKKALRIAEGVRDMVNPKLAGWSLGMILEGDLFIQAIFSADNGKLIDAKRLPAVSMERKTDDADNFIDPMRAFEQIDVNTQQTVATFPLDIMYHARWNWIDGNRYGEPEVVSARRPARRLDIVEEAQAIRRMTRAPRRNLWNLGTPENPSSDTTVTELKEKLGFKDGVRDVWDAHEVPTDYFGNGLVSAAPVGGDERVHEVDDIKMFQDQLVSAGLPTPGAVFGLASESINRDVLEDFRAQWLREVQNCSGTIVGILKWLLRLAWAVEGINPDWISFEIVVSDNSVEKPTVLAQRMSMLYESELVSLKQAVSVLAEVTGVEDVEKEVEAILSERQERMRNEIRFKQETGIPAARDGSAAGRNGKASDTRTKATASASSGVNGTIARTIQRE